MGILNDIAEDAQRVFSTQWDDVRKGLKVPEPGEVIFDGGAVELADATVLYADLDGSTNLVDQHQWSFAAEVYKTFLFAAARILKAEGGVITAYDGDRAMAVFLGMDGPLRAVRAGFKINAAVVHAIQPALDSAWSRPSYRVQHVIGIDRSPIHAARIGVRNYNDLVWIGRAANYAAKLASRDGAAMWVTSDVYGALDIATTYHVDRSPAWWPELQNPIGGVETYATQAYWAGVF